MGFKLKTAVISALLFILLGFNSSTFAWPAKINGVSEDKPNKAHFALDEPCDESCETLVEDLLYYIERGKEEIQLCNETEFTMFVGLTKTGKSTLVQFIGNSTNDLISICDQGGECLIQDDSGSIGEGIASETFLPNLVIDHETNEITSALYDMPGFNDNRPKSVEIANALFFQTILKHSDSIKIIVLTSHASMNIGDGISFQLLIKNLVNLIKDPKKFSGGISLVVNRADFHKTDDQHYYTYISYLKGFLATIDNATIDVGNKENAKAILQQFLVTETTNGLDATNIAFMRNAVSDGSIREQEQFQSDYIRLKKVIYDTTTFIPKLTEDFGNAISGDAIIVLHEAARKINANISTIVTNIRGDVANSLNNLILEISNGNFTNLNELEQKYNSLVNSTYPKSSNPNLDPNEYVTEIHENIEKFLSNTEDQQFQFRTLATLGEHLSLLHSVEPISSIITPLIWVQLLLETKSLVIQNLELNAENLNKNIEFILTNIRTDVCISIIELILDLESGDTSNLLKLETRLKNLFFSEYPKCSEPDLNPTEYVTEILNNLDGFVSDTEDQEEQMTSFSACGESLKFLHAMQPISKSINPENWVFLIQQPKSFILDQVRATHIIINNKITDQITIIKKKISKDLNEALLEFSQENYSRIEEIRLRFEKLLESLYPKSGEDFLDPNEYIAEIVLNIKTYASNKENGDIDQLDSLGKQLSLLYSFDNTSIISQKEWVRILLEIKTSVIDEFSETALTDITENVFISLKELNLNVFQLILSDIKEKTDVDDKFLAAVVFKNKTNLAVTATNEEIIRKNGSLSQFIRFTDNQYKIIYPKLVNYPEMWEKFLNYAPIIEVAELLGPIAWNSEQSWGFPISELQKYLSTESDWIRFLTSLFDELETSTVQIEIDDDAHSFRENNPVTTYENFLTHWNRLSEIPINTVKNGDQEKFYSYVSINPYALDAFNVALNFTLTDKRSTCPNNLGGAITFEGNYIPLKHVSDCLIGLADIPQKVVILAQRKVFIHSDFDYTKFKTTSPIELFIMAPKWDVSSNNKIQISGLVGNDPEPMKLGGTSGCKGDNGDPGTPGSDIIGIYKLWNRKPTAITSGGNGGVGQGGADGEKGENGVKQILRTEGNNWVLEAECAAWSADKKNLQVRLYPNSCNEPGTERCTAGDKGILVTIGGTGSSSGNPGGDGGEGGNGGLPGTAYYLDVNSTTPVKEIGNSGIQGNKGSRGVNGPVGSPGPDNMVTLDDRYKDGGSKRCQVLSGNLQQFSIQNNSSVVNNSKIVNPVPKLKVMKAKLEIQRNANRFEDFQDYIKMFLITSKDRSNEFIFKELTEFVEEVENNSLLQ